MSYESLTDDEMDKMQNDYKLKNNIDIPHPKSIHYYKFPKGTNTKLLCKELMKLPSVRLAYPTRKVHSTATATVIGSIANNETTPKPITDPELSYGVSSDYYWFDKHQIFKAWTYYNARTASLPKIAVIDSGFDVNSQEVNLTYGYSVKEVTPGTYEVKSQNNNTCPNNSCVQETYSDTPTGESHGSMVASVLAGKKNNGIGGAGVIPNATIVPIKLVKTTAYGSNPGQTLGEIIKSIQLASIDPSIDVINISWDAGGNPLNSNTDVNAAISYAIATYNKPVVITVADQAIAVNGLPTEAIVVGGSMYSTVTGKSKAWNNSAYYDKNLSAYNPIDMTASAYNIGAYAYIPSLGNSVYKLVFGTSFAAPMVSATLGMMKKLNSTLTARQLKNIIIYSSNVYKYDDGYGTPISTNRYIGRDLDKTSVNNGFVAGIRDLNTYNSLVIAKNINSYLAITRAYNVDDNIESLI